MAMRSQGYMKLTEGTWCAAFSRRAMAQVGWDQAEAGRYIALPVCPVQPLSHGLGCLLTYFRDATFLESFRQMELQGLFP